MAGLALSSGLELANFVVSLDVLHDAYVCRRASLVTPNYLEMLENEPIKLRYWDFVFQF